jgi:hypothetical protein
MSLSFKIFTKKIEIDWDTVNPNKMFRARENIIINFKIFGLALGK